MYVYGWTAVRTDKWMDTYHRKTYRLVNNWIFLVIQHKCLVDIKNENFKI